jgi:hypothetical protein
MTSYTHVCQAHFSCCSPELARPSAVSRTVPIVEHDIASDQRSRYHSMARSGNTTRPRSRCARFRLALRNRFDCARTPIARAAADFLWSRSKSTLIRVRRVCSARRAGNSVNESHTKPPPSQAEATVITASMGGWPAGLEPASPTQGRHRGRSCGSYAPMSSFQSSGRLAMKSVMSRMHAGSCNTSTTTPRDRSSSSSP